MRSPPCLLAAIVTLATSLGCAPKAPPSPWPSAPPERPRVHVDRHLAEPSAPAVIDACGHTRAEVQDAFRSLACHPSEHEIAIDPNAETLDADALAFVDAILGWVEADDQGGSGPRVLIGGGPGGLLIQAALVERGLDCRQIHARPEQTGAIVEVHFVCSVCCLL